MKQVIFSILSVMTISSFSLAAQSPKPKDFSQKICDSFQTKIDDECAHIMCDDFIADGSIHDLDECTSGDDYAEAAQGGCDGQPTSMESLVQDYNKKHPTAKIMCE